VSGKEDFDGLGVLVTGGSRGIGRAICLAFAEAGARIAFFYREHHDAAHDTVAALEAAGSEGRALCVDVSDDAAVEQGVGELAGAGFTADVLVNCAGINIDRTAHKLSVAEWREVVDVNLTGSFICSRAVLPHMREAGFGRIVNISSIIGQTGNLGQTNYAAAKAGIIGLTKSLAQETARHDITVNAVCPGFIETDMLWSVPEQAREQVLARIPKGRFGQPEEIARAVTWLAAPASGFITGQQINVNGGHYM
jgi:NAD(P)-dependent dehydrogenase (short-subunit alcohol dehydrogenase family)